MSIAAPNFIGTSIVPATPAPPADGGPKLRDGEYPPQPGHLDFAAILRSFTGHSVPGSGTNRQAIPPPLRIAASGIMSAFLGPAGVAMSITGAVLAEILSLKPDTTGSPAPPGMLATGSEQPYAPPEAGIPATASAAPTGAWVAALPQAENAAAHYADLAGWQHAQYQDRSAFV